MSEQHKKENIVLEKSYVFALESVKLFKIITKEHKEFILSKQFVRSATSVSANINEAQSAESKKDFSHKLNISLKEARETMFWLRLLNDSEYISNTDFSNLSQKCDELIKLLNRIIITAKNNNQ
jgi:four helix bundle protein